MRSPSKICLLYSGLLFVLIPFLCYAQNKNAVPAAFHGQINADKINIRSDATVGSKIICIMNKGEPVEVIKDSYDWYKIRLPGNAPSFIRKDLVYPINEKTAKVIKDTVNIRLRPNESSPILGKAGKNEVINILEEKGGWYKIEPLSNSFGWVHKKFVSRVETPDRKEAIKVTKEVREENKIVSPIGPPDEIIITEGIIKPYGKVIKRTATHKLIAADNRVFLLKGNKASLDTLNYHKVKVTGKLVLPQKQKNAIIEIQKIEALD